MTHHVRDIELVTTGARVSLAHLVQPDGSVSALVEAFVDGDYDFKELVVALVVNDGYRYASPASAEEGN